MDKLITNIKFRTSNNFKDNNVIIKNIGTVRKIASFFVNNTLSKKKKKPLTSIFIINIKARFFGVKVTA